jgi:hypothetical protein
MWRFSLFLLVAPLLAQPRPLDVVLLVERSPGVQLLVSPAAFTMAPADRVAVVSFGRTSHIEQPFTNDIQKIRTAIYRLNRQDRARGPAPPSSAPQHHHLLGAVLDSIRLFAPSSKATGRESAIVAIFATEDVSTAPASDELRKALLAAQIKFSGAAVHFRSDCCPLSPIQTPPTVPGRYTLIQAPLPEMTMKVVAGLASATGGQVLTNADLSAILAIIHTTGVRGAAIPAHSF